MFVVRGLLLCHLVVTRYFFVFFFVCSLLAVGCSLVLSRSLSVGGWWLVFVLGCLFLVVCCLLCVVACFVLFVARSLLVVSCLLSVLFVRSSWVVDCCLWFVVCCLLLCFS